MADRDRRHRKCLSDEEDDPDESKDTSNPYSCVGAETGVGRNEPCLCGSNRKYKKCCLLKG